MTPLLVTLGVPIYWKLASRDFHTLKIPIPFILKTSFEKDMSSENRREISKISVSSDVNIK